MRFMNPEGNDWMIRKDNFTGATWLLSVSASSSEDVSESTAIRKCPTLFDFAFLERGVISGLECECEVVVCECVDAVIAAND